MLFRSHLTSSPAYKSWYHALNLGGIGDRACGSTPWGLGAARHRTDVSALQEAVPTCIQMSASSTAVQV